MYFSINTPVFKVARSALFRETHHHLMLVPQPSSLPTFSLLLQGWKAAAWRVWRVLEMA